MRELVAERNKKLFSLPKGEAGLNETYYRYQQYAGKKGREFSLTKEEFKSIQSQPCHYCGIKTSKNEKGYAYNGIDRVDNERGYHKDNCVPCCYTCNRAKGTLTHTEFMAWVKRLTAYQRKRTKS
jgi:hypothetical protein